MHHFFLSARCNKLLLSTHTHLLRSTGWFLFPLSLPSQSTSFWFFSNKLISLSLFPHPLSSSFSSDFFSINYLMFAHLFWCLPFFNLFLSSSLPVSFSPHLTHIIITLSPKSLFIRVFYCYTFMFVCETICRIFSLFGHIWRENARVFLFILSDRCLMSTFLHLLIAFLVSVFACIILFSLIQTA